MSDLAKSKIPLSFEWQTMENCPKDRIVLMAAEFDRAWDWRIKTGGWHDSGYWFVSGASWTPTMWRDIPEAPSISIREIRKDQA